MICVGGGAPGASTAITEIAERLGAPVIGSTNGKGIIPDTHPLSLRPAPCAAKSSST